MPKPLDSIRQIAQEVDQQDELVAATKQALSATIRSYNQWQSHLNEISNLTAKYGMNNLLTVAAQLDENASTLLSAMMTEAATFHTAITDDPFPTMHAEPVPPPEEEEVPE